MKLAKEGWANYFLVNEISAQAIFALPCIEHFLRLLSPLSKESWLEKGADRHLAWNHGQGQSTPDTRAERELARRHGEMQSTPDTRAERELARRHGEMQSTPDTRAERELARRHGEMRSTPDTVAEDRVRRRRSSQDVGISDSIYGLTLAWITSENSTKQLECRHLLGRSFFTGPYLPCWSHRSGVRCWLSLSVVPRQLSFVSPYHFRIRWDFRFKNPLSGFAPKQTKESSAWRATYIVLHFEQEGAITLNIKPLNTSSHTAVAVSYLLKAMAINIQVNQEILGKHIHLSYIKKTATNWLERVGKKIEKKCERDWKKTGHQKTEVMKEKEKKEKKVEKKNNKRKER